MPRVQDNIESLVHLATRTKLSCGLKIYVLLLDVVVVHLLVTTRFKVFGVLSLIIESEEIDVVVNPTENPQQGSPNIRTAWWLRFRSSVHALTQRTFMTRNGKDTPVLGRMN